MSNERNTSINIGIPWLIIFVIIKLGGTSLASWSWWWVLLPIVPDVVFVLHKMGYML